MSSEVMLFLIGVVVVLPISVSALWMYFDYKKKSLPIVDGGDQALTTTELQSMIETSVERATADLADRVEALDNRLRIIETPLIDSSTGLSSEQDVSKTVGRKQRE